MAQPIENGLTKDSRELSNSVVSNSNLIFEGKIIDSLVYANPNGDRLHALTRFLVRVTHVFRGEELLKSDLIEVETIGGVVEDSLSRLGADIIGTNVHASVGNYDFLIDGNSNEPIFFFIKEKIKSKKFNESASSWSVPTLDLSGRYINLAIIGYCSACDSPLYINGNANIKFVGLHELAFKTKMNVLNYLSDFKDIKMPVDFEKKQLATVGGNFG